MMKALVRLSFLIAVMATTFLLAGSSVRAGSDPLPSWNEGPAKHAIVEFIRATTDPSSTKFAPPEERIAVFDQDGTLWASHPIYPQLMYCLDRLPAVVQARPALAKIEPFKTALSRNMEAISKLSTKDLIKIMATPLSGMSVERFRADAEKWLETARHPRWGRRYTELTYLPMLELMKHLRANGYKTYIVTGGGQDFVRVYAEKTYGVPPEEVVGTLESVSYRYDSRGRPVLIESAETLLSDVGAGKPEAIHLMIGRRPRAAFGNSTGDRQMLEYTTSGDGARLGMLVLHDDVRREYAYGPALGLPDTRIGAFPQSLHDEAKRQGWFVISMKSDWSRIWAFEQ
ncbi:HAD family hydrolase [Methylocystis sp. H4A]|uniref:HAD family hydrolase n=1 Tax=Methylocystis sp. H4A TaxID=2785788 RepID=UPI001AEEF9B5|nr:HAD family hydrolase [Methylocystis sp. H4A]